jgi:hypothetical protein
LACAVYDLGGILLVLKRRLLEVLGGISGSVLLLVEFSFCRDATVNSLVLLSGLAGGISGAVRTLILFRLETLDLLLRLGDVLHDMLGVFGLGMI